VDSENPTDEEQARLTVVCEDGARVGCANFTALDSGVLLTEDLKRNRVVGFVPHDELRYVLPSDVVRSIDAAEEPSFADELMELPQLGETYAKRLRASGYDSMSGLAAADAETLAEATGAREAVAAKWIDRATERAAEGSASTAPATEGSSED
jgi:hypothetical protein